MTPHKYLKSIYARSPYWIENLLTSIYGFKKAAIEKNKQFMKILADLKESQYFSTSKLQTLQESKLRSLILYVYENVPYYNEVFKERGLKPQDINCCTDLQKLPFLDKDIIKKRFNDLIAKNVDRKTLIWNHTSGTTGTPFGLYVDQKVENMWNALLFRHRSWGDFFFQGWHITLAGHVIVPTKNTKPPYWRFNLPNRQVLFSSYHLSLKNLPLYVKKMQSLKAEIINGYPSAIFILARFIVKKGIKIPLKAVFVASEPLYNYQRQIIKKAFDCEVFNLYGLAERSCSSGECERHGGNHLHMEEAIVEIIRNNQLVNDGEVGEIVGTSLINYVMPLIRYKTGDISAFKEKNCSCGRGLKLMREVDTKKEDIITTPDGRYISPSILTHPLKPLHGIIKSQIIQEDKYNFTIKIVSNNVASNNDTKLLIDSLKERLGEKAKIHIEFVDDIPRTKSGKFRFVISKVPLIF